jgi:hypothetical protein
VGRFQGRDDALEATQKLQGIEGFGIGDGATGRVGHVIDQLERAGRLASDPATHVDPRGRTVIRMGALTNAGPMTL